MDPELYEKTYTFLEGGDYIVYKLCGKIVRSGVFAGAKGFHDNKKMQFPDKEFLKGLDPRLENIVEEKHLTNVARVGTPAGHLTAGMAQSLASMRV
jgi:L-ribulokinase